MAKKPFKIANSLDLSGNKLIDVAEIYRGNYDLTGVNNHLLIRAGSDPAGLPDTIGGDLILHSGSGATAAGSIQLLVAGNASSYGAVFSADTTAAVKTNNKDILLSVDAASATSGVKVTATTNSISTTTGALQVAGGAYIAKDLVIDGGYIKTTATPTYNIFNELVTTANIVGQATSLNIGHLTTAAKTVKIATGGPSNLGSTDVTIGTDVVGSIARLRGRSIYLGENVTTVKVGGVFTGNTFKMESSANGTVNYTTGVIGGTVNFLNSVTGTANLLNAATTIGLAKDAITDIQLGSADSVVTVGGADATLYVGTSLGSVDTKTAASAANVFNTNATTVHAFGAATELYLGNEAAATTLRGLTLTLPQLHTVNLDGASSSSITLQGSTATTLNLFDTKQTTVEAFGAAASIDMGATTGTFSINNATFQLDNATTVNATKASTIALGTDAVSNVAVDVGKAGYTTTATFHGSTINLASSSTGILNLFDSNITTASILAGATTINVGSAAATAVVNFNTTKDATSLADAGIVIDGGVAIAQQLLVGGSTTLGDAIGDVVTITGLTSLLNNSASYPLRFGNDVNVYRGGTNILEIDDHVTINGVSGTTNLLAADTVNAFTTSVTAVNIAKAGSLTTIQGNLQVDQDIELKGFLDYAYFRAHAALRPHRAGELYYSTIDDTLMFTPSVADVELSIGQELYARVRNATAATIPNGTVVYRVNGSEDYVSVAPAQASSAAKSAVLGIATHDIPVGSIGFVTVRGIVRGINTSALSIGKAYLSTVEGQMTSTPPTTTNYVVELGDVQRISSTEGSIYVTVQQSWSSIATFNNLRAVDVTIHNDLRLPVVTAESPVAGSIRYSASTSDKFIKAYDGVVWKTIVDTDSVQDLTNKTYEGLVLTELANSFTIKGGAASEKTLTVEADLTINTGKVELSGSSSGASALTLPNNLTTIQALTNGYVLYASAANTIGAEQRLSVVRGGSGLGSLDVNYFYKGNGTSAVAKSNLYDDGSSINVVGNSDLTMLSGDGRFIQNHSSTSADPSVTINHGGAKAAASSAMAINYTATGSVAAEKKALTISTSGTWSGGANKAIHVAAVGGSSNYSFYGESGLLHNVHNISTAGDLAVNGGGITSTATTFNLFNSTVTTLNLMSAASSVTNVGSNDSNTRTMNVYGDMNIGSITKSRVVNHYGQFNFGGPTGFTILYNNTDDSFDFIKL